MPRIVPSEFKQTKNLLQNKPVHLFTVYDYDGAGSNLYWAEYDVDVVFNGVTYSRFPITFDKVSENSAGTIDQMTVTLSNVSRLIQSYLEDYDFRGKKVSLKTVWADQLSDVDNFIEEILYVDSYTSDALNVSINLSSKFDVLDVALPARQYSRNYCQFVFKGTECAYAGAVATCDKTKQTCKTLSNFQRFGGFPSIQPNRVALG